MALIKCKECNKGIAKDAKICPNCGTLTKYGKEVKEKNKKTFITLIVSILILIVLVYTIVNYKREKDKIVGKWVYEYEITIGKTSTSHIDVFIFNSDGTCENVNEYSNDPCSYKIKDNEITITWLNDAYWYDENKNEVKSLTMPFFQGEDYIIIDEDKYEKEN